MECLISTEQRSHFQADAANHRTDIASVTNVSIEYHHVNVELNLIYYLLMLYLNDNGSDLTKTEDTTG